MSSNAVRTHLSRSLIALLAMLLVLPAAQLLGAAPAHADPGVASGAVYDALGDPVSGVTVRAYAAPGYVTPGPSATTDADGAYDLPLPAGTYHLTFAKAGYATATYGGTEPVDLVVEADGDITIDGEPVEDNYLDDVTLESLQERDVTGLVKSTSGPLNGILVTAHRSDDPEVTADTATTAGGGLYTLQLPLGRYFLSYADTGSTYLPTWYGGAEPGREITVQANGSILVDEAPSGCASLCDVTLTAAAANTEYPIAGDVLDANGDPISGISVAVTPTGASTDSGTGSTTTEGLYSVSVLPGTYRVAFSGTGFVAAPYTGDGGETQATVTVANNGVLSVTPIETLTGNRLNTTTLTSVAYPVGGRVVRAAVPAQPLAGITVRAFNEGDRTEVVNQVASNSNGFYTLQLPVGSYDVQLLDEVADGTSYVLTWLGGATPVPVKVGQGGTITYNGGSTLPDVGLSEPPADATYAVGGVVTDALGEPVGGVGVTATHTGSTPADQDTSTTTATAGENRGTYSLALEAGTYRLSYAGGSAFADATYNGDGETAATITVEANGVVRVGATEVVGGVLEPVALVGKTTYPLTGRVTNGAAPLIGIAVKVYPEDQSEPGSEIATTTTGPNGSFTANLTIGSYVVQFSGTSGGVLYSTRWYGAAASPGTPVQVGQGGVVSVDGVPGALGDVVMAPATVDSTYPLRGSVYDANYDSLAGVLATAEPISGGAATDTATSDADGLFQLDLKPGTYEVSFQKAGVYAKTYYLDPEGDTGTERARVVVALNGVMTIGDSTLTAGLNPQVLVGTTRHPVTGTVLSQAGTGLSGITVQAFLDGEPTPAASVTSGAGGTYTLQLLVGTYRIRFTDDVVAAPTYAVTYVGGATAASVKVATGGEVRVDDVPVTGALAPVTMTEVASDVTYTLKGLVYDERYEPLSGAAVQVVPVSGTPAANAVSGTTGSDPVTGAETLGDAGVYRLEVHPGKYQLRFTKTGYQTTFLTTFEDLTKPVTVTVAGNGVISAPGLQIPGGVLDDVQLLLPAPKLLTAPRLTGKLAVGQKVTATFGTWSPNVTTPAYRDSTYVEWFLDGKAADDYTSGYNNQVFTVPLAGVGKKLSYRVTISDPDGFRASAIYTSAGVKVPQAVSSVTGAFKKGKLTVTVKVPGLPKPTGKVTVLKGKKKLASGTLVAKKKGVLVLDLSKLKKGKYKLTIVYAGPSAVKGSKRTITIKV